VFRLSQTLKEPGVAESPNSLNSHLHSIPSSGWDIPGNASLFSAYGKMSSALWVPLKCALDGSPVHASLFGF
jgi:hypothetical protein